MLQSLRVKDFVLFGELDLEFGERLVVVSGETGAGKSIMLGALGLLLGDDASETQVRQGAERAVVEGLFLLPGRSPGLGQLLLDSGLADSAEERELVIRREISAAGRSRAFVNGRMTNLGVLKQLGDSLIEIHGQQEHQRLVKPARQLELLDIFGRLQDQRESFAGLLARRKACQKNLARLRETLERHRGESELMRFQLEEINQAAPSPEEESQLQAELQLLENAERIRSDTALLLTHLEGGAEQYSAGDQGRSVLDRLGGLHRVLESLAGMAVKAAPLVASVKDARYILEDVVSALREIARSVDDNPGRLEQVRERLDLLYRLKKKYGPALDDVLSFRDRVADSLKGAEHDESALDKLAAELDELDGSLKKVAASLTASRRKAAQKLENEVSKRMSGLAMEKGSFQVAFDTVGGEGPQEEYLTSGADRITFLLTTNPGVPLMPLSRVASGGELSRIMLALKSALALSESPSTMIFDEVDSGIGGKVGRTVGRYLSDIARKHQVLVVTHLAQIARYADTHLLAEKIERGLGVETRVRRLSPEERPGEIARMLGGDAESELSLAHARQMLDETGNKP